MLVQHVRERPAFFPGRPCLAQDGEENVFLGGVALVGKLLEEPGRPRWEVVRERLPGVDACHGLFEQGQATLDQLVFGFQAINRFHDDPHSLGSMFHDSQLVADSPQKIFRHLISMSSSMPLGEKPSTTPGMPRPWSVSAKTTSSGWQWHRNTADFGNHLQRIQHVEGIEALV